MQLSFAILKSVQSFFVKVMVVAFFCVFLFEGFGFYQAFQLKKKVMTDYLSTVGLETELSNDWINFPKSIRTFESSVELKDKNHYDVDVFKNNQLIYRSDLQNDSYIEIGSHELTMPGGTHLKIVFRMNLIQSVFEILKPFLIIMLISLVTLMLFFNHVGKIISTSLRPLSGLLDSFQSGEQVQTDVVGIKEFDSLRDKILDYKRNKEENEQLKIDLTVQEKMLELAQMVSHDIRSPLNSLKMAVDDVQKINNEQRFLINHSIQRINDIALNLLKGKKNQVPELHLKNENIAEVSKQLFEAKKLEFKNQTDLTLSFVNELHSETTVLIDLKEFSRIFSNLINNSVEAMEKGDIQISLKKIEDQKIAISIADNGRGMSEDFLKRLGEKGLSEGKKESDSGSGLGVYHAKKIIAYFNGYMTFESTINKGTTVSIILPVSETEKKAEVIYDYVYIDDDRLLRIGWNKRAKEKQINLLTLAGIDEFATHELYISKVTTHIYIDFDLGKESKNGLDFALELHQKGYQKIHMASGHGEEHFKQYPWLVFAGKVCPF